MKLSIVICTSYESYTSFMNLQFNQANEWKKRLSYRVIHNIFLQIVVSWEIWPKKIYEKLKKSRYALPIISKEMEKMMQKSTAFITIFSFKKVQLSLRFFV
jgi:hypothetical protein